jgi:hypothetical protein
MQFSSLPSWPGSRSEGRREVVGSFVAAYEGTGDVEGGAMIERGRGDKRPHGRAALDLSNAFWLSESRKDLFVIWEGI